MGGLPGSITGGLGAALRALRALCAPRSFELVQGLLPAEYHKVLVNIRKAEARSRKQRALRQAAAETEEEEEEEAAQPRGDR